MKGVIYKVLAYFLGCLIDDLSMLEMKIRFVLDAIGEVIYMMITFLLLLFFLPLTAFYSIWRITLMIYNDMKIANEIIVTNGKNIPMQNREYVAKELYSRHKVFSMFKKYKMAASILIDKETKGR